MKWILIFFCTISSAMAALTHESEVSSVSTGGNTNVETYLGRTNNTYTFDVNTLRFGGHYTYGEADENVSARDWDINAKYDRMFTDRFAYLFGELIEGYKFQGIKARYNSDAGIKYYFKKSDHNNIFTELGYRYTSEDRYFEETRSEHKGRVYAEFNHKPSDNFQYRLWAEYVPNFSDTKDYIVNFEGSITSMLSETFSLRVAYKGLYDDDPAISANRNYDYSYTTSLVAKF